MIGVSRILDGFVSFDNHVVRVVDISYISPMKELTNLNGHPVAGFTLVVGPAEVYLSKTGAESVKVLRAFRNRLVAWVMKEEWE